MDGMAADGGGGDFAAQMAAAAGQALEGEAADINAVRMFGTCFDVGASQILLFLPGPFLDDAEAYHILAGPGTLDNRVVLQAAVVCRGA